MVKKKQEDMVEAMKKPVKISKWIIYLSIFVIICLFLFTAFTYVDNIKLKERMHFYQAENNLEWEGVFKVGLLVIMSGLGIGFAIHGVNPFLLSRKYSEVNYYEKGEE